MNKSILKEAVGRGQYWFLMSIKPILTSQMADKHFFLHKGIN